MKKRILIIIPVAFFLFLSYCNRKEPKQYNVSDPNATRETKNLYTNLNKLRKKGVVFGQEDALAYGIGWEANKNDFMSDVKKVTGDHPGIFGWDLGHIADSKNIDGVSFDNMKTWIKKAYEKNGIITISWHQKNPINKKSSWDTTRAIKHLLPGGKKHDYYIEKLDMVGDFIADLKGENGERIPVLFRPYHEFEGDWFWWGKPYATPDQFKSLWRMTADYLREEKNLHNILWVYNPNFKQDTEAEKYYPGDKYVDFVGVDSYSIGQEESSEKTSKRIDSLISFANKYDKIPCLSEGGYNMLPDSTWWTEDLLPLIENKGLAYALVWRNARKDHFFAPYPGQKSAENFQKFNKDSSTIFLSDLPNLYRKK